MSDSWETMWYAGAASSECASDVHTCRPRISVMGKEGGGAARAKAARQEEQVGDLLSRDGVVVRRGADEGAGQTVGLAGPVQMPLSRPCGQHALKKEELQRALIWR